MDDKAFLAMNNNLKNTKHFHHLHHYLQLYKELSGIFTTSTPLFTVFKVFLKNDKIDLEDMTTLLTSNSLTLHLSHRGLVLK